MVSKLSFTFKAACAVLLFGVSQAANAERIETYWRLKPVEPSPSTAVIGQPFSEQRLLPVKLARLDAPATIGRRNLAEGTLLYLVFNEDGRIGYCTIKDRSGGNLARTLFIPIADQRPCLTDRDGDGRFDAAFSVYDKYGGPPSVRGSINGARPIAAPVAFSMVDPEQFPIDMRMRLEFRGSRTRADETSLRLTFTKPINGSWPDVLGKRGAEGVKFDIGNVALVLRSVVDGTAAFAIEYSDLFISTNNRNTLFWGELPRFLR
jgi:hypothetical protein